MRHRRLVLATVLLATLAARDAAGDTWHLKSPFSVMTEKGSTLKLPPGYFLDERTWQERDAELKRLQADETRKKAENESLRKSAEDIPWKTVICAVTFGAFVGYLGYQYR